MKQKIIITSVTVAVLLAVSLFIVLINKPKTISPRPQTTTAPTLTPSVPAHSLLSLEPNPLIVSGNSASVTAQLNTNDNNATGVQLEIAYDPKVFSNAIVQPANAFQSHIVLLNKVNKQTGRITFAIGITPGSKPFNGQGTVATLTFTKKYPQPAVASSQITLLPTSLVSAAGSISSVMQSVTSTTVQFSQ